MYLIIFVVAGEAILKRHYLSNQQARKLSRDSKLFCEPANITEPDSGESVRMPLYRKGN